MAATNTAYLAGNFAPVEVETTATDLPVTGSVPADLTGRLLRIGPNPVVVEPGAHWFTGTGMVHGLRLDGGRADWYRNRYVRSDRVTEALGGPAVPGPRHGMGDGTANTHVMDIAGDTYALIEAGALPVRLTDELETVERSDFGGTLPGGFTAHPKRDPATGELHAVTYYWEWDHLKYLVIGTDGRVRRVVEVPVEGGPMVHDMGLTETAAILMDLPCVFDLELAMGGAPFPYRWDPDRAARVGVLPRDGEAADVVWCDVAPCYVFHALNAHDTDDGRIVMDVVRHPRMFDRDRLGPNDDPTTLDRWTIDPGAGTVKEERVDDHPVEFPRLDERRLGREARYGYTAHFRSLGDGNGVEMGGLLRHDLRAGSSEVWDPGPGRSCQEPVFVPRTPDASEEEGWLLSFVHDAATERADVVVLAADDLAAGPVASIHLPVRVPYGFHGSWVPDVG